MTVSLSGPTDFPLILLESASTAALSVFLWLLLISYILKKEKPGIRVGVGWARKGWGDRIGNMEESLASKYQNI